MIWLNKCFSLLDYLIACAMLYSSFVQYLTTCIVLRKSIILIHDQDTFHRLDSPPIPLPEAMADIIRD